MGVIANRNQAIRELNSFIANRNDVLIIHYSQLFIQGMGDDLSPMISSVIVRSIDNSINETFGIHIEADLVVFTTEDIEDIYPLLELSMLKKFNEFMKKHNNYTWIHWDMVNLDFGFQAIKHRFVRLSGEKAGRDFFEIPTNKKINLHNILNYMYGEKFVEGPDCLGNLIKINNKNTRDLHYLTLDQEGEEFNKKNYTNLIESLRCKTNRIAEFTSKLLIKKLKVASKNRYSIFIDFISHPIFNLIGWIAAVGGFIWAIMETLKFI